MNFFSYPFIDPVLIRVGPLEVRWYGLMYLLGFACAYLVIRSELKRKHGPIPVESADDLLFYLIVGMLIGARLGYAIFYNLGTYLAAPWEIFFIWHGGMSFHGGLVGMVIAGIIFSRRRNAPFMELADIGALAAPIGLMLGRIGNFINGELYGRVTRSRGGSFFQGAVICLAIPLNCTKQFLKAPFFLLSCGGFGCGSSAPERFWPLFFSHTALFVSLSSYSVSLILSLGS